MYINALNTAYFFAFAIYHSHDYCCEDNMILLTFCFWCRAFIIHQCTNPLHYPPNLQTAGPDFYVACQFLMQTVDCACMLFFSNDCLYLCIVTQT